MKTLECEVCGTVIKMGANGLKYHGLYFCSQWCLNEHVNWDTSLISEVDFEEDNDEDGVAMKSTFRICYGIKSYNSNGIERPYDTAVSEEFHSLAEAQASLRRYLDQMADEMATHHVNRRKHEVAFVYIREYPANCEDPDEWVETDFVEVAGDQIITGDRI